MEGAPHPLVYPVGAALWALGAWGILASVPPSARNQGVGMVLFLLPLGMAVAAAFVSIFAREGHPPGIQRAARSVTFALLWPFVAWGQWDAKRRAR